LVSSSGKTLLWVLIGLLAVPLTCCGSGYLYLFIKTPVTWDYVSDFVPPDLDHLKFNMGLRGDHDYQYDYQGPRRVLFNVNRDSEDTKVTIRLLDVKVTASSSGELIAFEQGSLPRDLPFTAGGDDETWAHWSGVDFDIEPDSGEIVKVVVTVEFTTPDSEPEILTLEAEFVPRRNHRPIWSNMPSA